MNKNTQNKLIAAIIIAGHNAGIKMDSPYALTNMWEDFVSTHSLSLHFFYDKKGNPIDAVKKAEETIAKIAN